MMIAIVTFVGIHKVQISLRLTPTAAELPPNAVAHIYAFLDQGKRYTLIMLGMLLRLTFHQTRLHSLPVCHLKPFLRYS